MRDYSVIIKKALKYLSMLKNGKQIKTAPQLLDLKETMEKLEELLYEKIIVSMLYTKEKSLLESEQKKN